MRQEKSLSTKNLMGNADAMQALKHLLKTPTESEAVRIAVQDPRGSPGGVSTDPCPWRARLS